MATVKTFMCRHLCMTAASTMDIHKMVAIFLIFFKMVNTDIPFLLTLRKPEPKLSGVGNLKFLVQLIFTKWQPFFDFFIMADTDILFLSTLGKLETQTLGGQ